MGQVFDELVGRGLLLGLGDDRECGAAVFSGDLVTFVPLRELGHAPVAGLVRSAVHEVNRHPCADGESGDVAFVERTIPVVGPVGDLGVDEVFVDELLLEFDVLLHAGILGHVNGDVLAINLPRLRTGLPCLGGEGLVFHGGTGIVGHVGADGLDLLGCLVIIVPSLDLGAVDAGLLEHGIVVEEDFRAGINRQRIRLAIIL